VPYQSNILILERK